MSEKDRVSGMIGSAVVRRQKKDLVQGHYIDNDKHKDNRKDFERIIDRLYKFYTQPVKNRKKQDYGKI